MQSSTGQPVDEQPTSPAVIIHVAEDSVGIAVRDLEAGEQAPVLVASSRETFTLRVREWIPFGHKVAVVSLDPSAPVIEYGRPIGEASRAILRGAHVHLHNLRSLRSYGRTAKSHRSR